MSSDKQQARKRLSISVLIALVIHAGIFTAVYYAEPFKPEEIPEYSGPVIVTLYAPEEEVPAVIDEASDQTAQVEEELRPPSESVPESTEVEVMGRVSEGGGEPEAAERQSFERYEVPSTDEGIEEFPAATLERRGVDPRMEVPQQTVRPAEEYFGTSEEETEDRSAKHEFTFPPVEEEEKPLAFDFDRLDRAIEEARSEPPELEDEEEPEAEETAEVIEESETGEAITERSTKPPARRSDAPVIVWEDEREGRTLLSKAGVPRIPSWVKEEGLSLRVDVVFNVTPGGHTALVKVVRSSGYTDVDTAVMEEVRRLRFNPIKEDITVRGMISYIISAR